jgi:predicted kinase
VFDEIENCFCEGKSCLVDATNLNPYHRQIYIEIAIEHEATSEARFFNTPFEECLRRIRLRDPSIRVSDNRMMGMKELWDNYHSNDLYSVINQLFDEGFKIVKVIKTSDNSFVENTYIDKVI